MERAEISSLRVFLQRGPERLRNLCLILHLCAKRSFRLHSGVAFSFDICVVSLLFYYFCSVQQDSTLGSMTPPTLQSANSLVVKHLARRGRTAQQGRTPNRTAQPNPGNKNKTNPKEPNNPGGTRTDPREFKEQRS